MGDEGMEEESDEEVIGVKDMDEEDMIKKGMNEKGVDGRLPDGIMQDGDFSDLSDTVMTDETIRPPEGRNYVCLPSFRSGKPGVIVIITNNYRTVVDHVHYLS